MAGGTLASSGLYEEAMAVTHADRPRDPGIAKPLRVSKRRGLVRLRGEEGVRGGRGRRPVEDRSVAPNLIFIRPWPQLLSNSNERVGSGGVACLRVPCWFGSSR